ncbi:MAG: DMT family transporter [Acidobacteria bacterium]|nr:DMT family transporter [Acidobacteriota bacterium]
MAAWDERPFDHRKAAFATDLAMLGVTLVWGLNFSVWSHGMRRIGVPRTVICSNITPIIALLGAWAALCERPSLGQLVGIALIPAGVFLVRSHTVRPGAESRQA